MIAGVSAGGGSRTIVSTREPSEFDGGCRYGWGRRAQHPAGPGPVQAGEPLPQRRTDEYQRHGDRERGQSQGGEVDREDAGAGQAEGAQPEGIGPSCVHTGNARYAGRRAQWG